VSGHHMGYQKNAVLLGRVSVRGGYRPPSPQIVELHRKSLRSGSKMGAGVATVPVRRAVPSRQIESVESCNRWPKWTHPVNGSKVAS